MPHVMPRAGSSKSSGRVRQIKQRSAEQECGCGCWCSGAAWVDGWAAFARVSGCRLWFFNGCAACGEAWMLAARLSVASGVVTAASMLSNADMQFCARTRGLPLASRLIPDNSEFKNGNTPLSRRHVSVGRPETCWSEQRPRHRHRGAVGRGGRRGAIYAGDRDMSLGSRALDDGRLSQRAFEMSQIVLSAFSIFQQSSHARARTTWKDRRAVAG